LQARRLLELDLREAIENDQLELHYQPIFDVAESRVRGVEALARWRHPVRGMVPPSAFIPLAEEIGVITRIGDWVIERACRDAMTWPVPITVAVNVSAAQFRQGSLVEKVVEVLFDTGLPARRLDLEITESVLLTNNAPTLVALNQLRELGIKISMDDFGTGYSSLSYLRSFPFDKVKIDQSFTRDICAKHEASAIVRTIIGLCRDLGMRTTAEGVETDEQLAFLREEGCQEAQGFHLSMPMPSADLVGYLEASPVHRTKPVRTRLPRRA
jgi:EAL domain-containing protein (putative c-di-GMP-specific phosphodiesterase class I)